MPTLELQLGSQCTLSVEFLLVSSGQSNKFRKKTKKDFLGYPTDNHTSLLICIFMFVQGRRQNVLVTSRINLPGRFLQRQIRTSPLDLILGRLQDVRFGCLWDGQIGSLWDVLGRVDGDILRRPMGTFQRPMFADRLLTSKNDQ